MSSSIADPRVSYHHAWIGIVDQKAVLRDLGSTNGTFLNAQIDAPVGEVVLSPGDTIFFGGHGRDQFRFVLD
jgi:pSer/pThr/pTyr-binding forkhead associated (FHA) protein